MDCELIISAERKAVELEISGDAQLHEKNAEVIAANEALDECVHGEVTGATYAENVAQAVNDFDDIAQAINEKGVDVPKATAEYADVIRNEMTVSAKTYEDGLKEGEDIGREKCWHEYWDTKQENGKRTTYYAAFSYEKFKAEQFIPKYDIVPASANSFFSYSKIDVPIVMKELEAYAGIVFDFSKCVNMSYAFQGSQIFSELNNIDISVCNNLTSAFISNTTIKRIERLICSEKTVFATTTFNGCKALEYIGFEGEITSANLDLHWSTLLNKECIQKLFNTLSTTTTGLAITLSKTAVANAFETATGLADGVTSDEWLALVASRSNWTINLI